jgi:alpha-beta hydrolase superfamily lysophospholipase
LWETELQHDEGFFRGFGGLELYYQRWAPKSRYRAVLVFIHGFSDHSSRHPNLVNRVAASAKAVYSFDLRGHGRSPGQRGYIGSWTELREDVAAFVRFVSDKEPGLALFLMGHSLGGLVVLEYALHFSEGLAGIIASSPSIGEIGVSPWKLAVGRLLSRAWPRFSLKAGLKDEWVSRDPDVVRASSEDPLSHGRGTARLASEMEQAIRWTRSHAAHLEVSLLVTHGSADRIVPPEAARSFFDGVGSSDRERYEYEGGYHELDNDTCHPEVLRDLVAWMDRRI